jgi:flagellar biosynthesis protein FlhF
VESDRDEEVRDTRRAEAAPGLAALHDIAANDIHDSAHGTAQAADAAVEPDAEPAPGLDTDFIYQALIYHGVTPTLAERLCRTAASMETADAALALGGALDAFYGFQPLPAAPARPLMLVGQPGAGKTVTVAKLAARAAIQKQPFAVITIDTVRAGAIEQLAAFTKLMNVDLITADKPDALTRALADLPADQAVYIDSPGTNPFNDQERADLEAFIAGADIEPVFVCPAGIDPVESVDIAEGFAALRPKRLLATRLDLARRLGGLVTAAEATRLAYCDVGITPHVAHGVSALNPVALARLLLRDPTNPDSRSDIRKANP